MLKTPPRLAGLGVALTMCSIGAGSAMSAGAVAAPADLGPMDLDSVQIERVRFDAPMDGNVQIDVNARTISLDLPAVQDLNC